MHQLADSGKTEKDTKTRQGNHQTAERKDLLEALWGEEVKQVEQLFQVVLKRSPSEQQLVVDLIPVEDSEKLDRTHCSRNDTQASKKNAMKCVKLPEREAPSRRPKSPQTSVHVQTFATQMCSCF